MVDAQGRQLAQRTTGTTSADHLELVAWAAKQDSVRLRWHLHELDPSSEPKARTLNHQRNLDRLAERLDAVDGPVAWIARDLTERCRSLTIAIKQPRAGNHPAR